MDIREENTGQKLIVHIEVETTHVYTSSSARNTKPIALYNVSGDGTLNDVTSVDVTNLTEFISTAATDRTTYVEDSNTVVNTNYLVAVSADVQNSSGTDNAASKN